MFGAKPQGVQHPFTKAGMSPAKVLAIGFFAIIMTGTLLLMLPLSNKSSRWLGFLEALFTATSATCVTGLQPDRRLYDVRYSNTGLMGWPDH